MKRNGLNFAALATRQAQLNPETALTAVTIRTPLPGRPSGVEVSTYQASTDARLLATLTPEQQEAMVRFHAAYRIRVGEAKLFLPPQYERIARTTGNLSEEKVMRNERLERQYSLWAMEAHLGDFDVRPCQHIAGLGQSIREAALDLRMRRTRCRELFIDGLDRFMDAGRTIHSGGPHTSPIQAICT